MNYRERGSHARGVYFHTVYLAHGNSKDEARDPEERNVDTKGNSPNKT